MTECCAWGKDFTILRFGCLPQGLSCIPTDVVCYYIVPSLKLIHCTYLWNADSAVAGSDSSYPTLQYSLYYDIQRNSLTVNLGQAFNLPTKAKSGSADTSVVLYMQPNKAEVFESKVVRKDLNPIFDQTFEFTGLLGVQVARKQTLILKVYGRSRYNL